MGGMSGATVWHLPNEVLVLIFSLLPTEDIGRVASVCSRWSQLAKHRRVWRGKSFLSEGSRGLSDALPIARALPVLKRVSVCFGSFPKVYLSGQCADFVVPNLRDEAVAYAISALATENLSIEFGLLDERCSNCLVVQLHKLKQLNVFARMDCLPEDPLVWKLRALGETLSREPLSKLKSVDINTNSYNKVLPRNMNSGILGALSTCPALRRVTVSVSCFPTWHTVTEFSKLQFLQLRHCIVDFSVLYLFPNLLSLSLDNCSLHGMQLLPHMRELRSLNLRRVSLTAEFVNTLCAAFPKLETIVLDEYPKGIHTLFRGRCRQLRCLEVSRPRMVPSHVEDLVTLGLDDHILDFAFDVSDSLAEILKHVPKLVILKVINCNIKSLRFLRHCRGLTDLSLNCSKTYKHLSELRRLRGLKKLCLFYTKRNVTPLADVLCKMPQLEVLVVTFRRRASNLSFLQYCHRLHCLILTFDIGPNDERLYFHELSNLKELRKLILNYEYLGVEDLVAVLPSMLHLEELRIGGMHPKCNFSFLHHCHRLTSFQISCQFKRVSHLTHLRQLEGLRRLTVIRLLDKYRRSLAEEVLRLPKLEYLGLQKDGPNFLESLEWRKMLSSVRLRAQTEENLKESP